MVPALCLTSAKDVVIPEAGVRQYADALREARPSRQVTVQSFPSGSHGQLVRDEPAAYASAINAFLVELSLDMASEEAPEARVVQVAEAVGILGGEEDELSRFLMQSNLGHLREHFGQETTLADQLGVLDLEGRAGLLNHLKETGLKLPDRQKLANSLSKEARLKHGGAGGGAHLPPAERSVN